jgi:hypothetical protein
MNKTILLMEKVFAYLYKITWKEKGKKGGGGVFFLEQSVFMLQGPSKTSSKSYFCTIPAKHESQSMIWSSFDFFLLDAFKQQRQK